MPSDALKQMSINNAPPQRDMGAVSRINQYKSLVSSGVNAQDARRQVRTGNFNPTIPPVIPSTDLAGNKTFEDVMDTRANLESEANAKQQLNTDYANLTTRIGNTTLPSPFTNPEEAINRLLLRGTTDTQRQLDEKGQIQADTIRGFASDYTKAGTEARTQFGIPELQTGLAETRNRIAERQVKLRETLRDFETNAERRGVAREFVDSEKAKVQADAATELADLSIIENAQLGNLNEARAEVDDILAEKRQAFEFENSAIEAEIARLDKMDTREAEVRSEQLQIALQERTRNIETALANEKEQRGYLVDAAANGADQGTLMAIRNAKTPQEAAFLASPFIGKIDREQARASIAQSWSGLKLREDELALARDKFESESNEFGTGTVTMTDGTKAVVGTDGTITPVSEINFDDPSQVDALPVSNITKAVIQGIGKTKDLTPTQKGEVLSELQKIGFNPNTYIVNKLNGLVQTWANVPETSKGYVEGLKFWESKTNQDVAEFESQRTLLTREIARLFDVGVLSDQDVAAYKDAMPSRQDADLSIVLSKASGIAGAATGKNTEGVGKLVELPDGRKAIVGLDGDTLLDPATGKPLE